MKDSHNKLLEQFSQMAAEGKFGEVITASQHEYDQLPVGIATMLKVVEDFCVKTADHSPEVAQIRRLVCQLIIVAYREARRKDPDSAMLFIPAFPR